MVEVVISPLAKEDMAQIAEYIRRELSNADASLRLLRLFRETILRLRDFPELGAPVLPDGQQAAYYRMLVCGNYLIFYHTEEGFAMVDRVLYGRRDYLPLLFGDQLPDE